MPTRTNKFFGLPNDISTQLTDKTLYPDSAAVNAAVDKYWAGVDAANTPVATRPDYKTLAQLATESNLDSSKDYNTAAESYFANNSSTPLTDAEKADIRTQTRARMQAQIDAINNEYTGIIAAEKPKAEERLGETRAISARSGLLGSPRGAAQKDKMTSYNAAVEAGIRAEQETKIQAILGKADEMAQAQISDEVAGRKKNAGDYLSYLKTQQDDMKTKLSDLAKSNISLDSLSQDEYSKLLSASGFDNQSDFELYYNAQKSKASQIDWKSEKLADGQLLLWGQDPATGEIKQQKITSDIKPEEEWKEVGGIAYGVSKDANGNLVLRKLTNKQTGTGTGTDNYDVIKSQLDASKGIDSFVNTDTYKKLRASAKDKTSFDKNYSYMLNPNDASAKQFLTTEKSSTQWEQGKAVWAWLATPEAQAMSDEDKAKEVMANGFDPADFNL